METNNNTENKNNENKQSNNTQPNEPNEVKQKHIAEDIINHLFDRLTPVLKEYLEYQQFIKEKDLERREIERKRDIYIQLINAISITLILLGILVMIYLKGFNSDYVSFMVIAAWVIYSYVGNSNFLKFGNKKDK